MGQLFAPIICNIETADTVRKIYVGIVVNLIISERTCFKENPEGEEETYVQLKDVHASRNYLPRMLGMVNGGEGQEEAEHTGMAYHL